MKRYQVLLESGTVGELVCDESPEGKVGEVRAKDENGRPYLESGKVIEVLQAKEIWE
jgi:hypothetical protein